MSGRPDTVTPGRTNAGTSGPGRRTTAGSACLRRAVAALSDRAGSITGASATGVQPASAR